MGLNVGKGWHGESHRHSLARKGIKTVVYLPKKRYSPIKTGNTTVSNENGLTRVTLYNTNVVTFDDKFIELNTGGYETSTTKDRMNSTSEKFDLGYRVYQKDYRWYVDYKGKTYKFGGDYKVGNQTKSFKPNTVILNRNPNTKEEKYERCVKKLKPKQNEVNPYAVCRKSVYGSRKERLEKKHPELKETEGKSRFEVAREERKRGTIK